ncbi:MAG: hypothetical protein CMO80_02340 [Verrucomicrobiales bacterium]|nr:hypothetical protein [Verrucomicrobiales bacterium]|tara:strand:+ start:5896 stop:6084 length:189 start_codon:yes stop_codon:yes gene_type:complete
MSDQDIRKFSSRGAVRDPNLQAMRNHKPAIEISPSRDVGTIKGNTFSYTPKGSDRGKTSPSA